MHEMGLMVVNEGAATMIDLDEGGWRTKHPEIFEKPGQWFLVRPDGTIPLSMWVNEGEKPYVMRRTIGQVFVATGVDTRVHAWGIGKERTDGHFDRLWVFPDGQVCGGDDIDQFGQLKAARAAQDGHDREGSSGDDPAIGAQDDS